MTGGALCREVGFSRRGIAGEQFRQRIIQGHVRAVQCGLRLRVQERGNVRDIRFGKAGISFSGLPLRITGPMASPFTSWLSSGERIRSGAREPVASLPWQKPQD